uniref:CID domain-containing protein n=1 Tax=Mucochytrium quahogii TaxID=96639 RepID=A0A7S2WT92_9STRA|mmetsp:Transcript_5127/g.7799  ORF Transcript_5127/g.7799 Transcript_5127/m.7799 type:complete len:403 (+) Transcript_5127:102-1310(+)
MNRLEKLDVALARLARTSTPSASKVEAACGAALKLQNRSEEVVKRLVEYVTENGEQGKLTALYVIDALLHKEKKKLKTKMFAGSFQDKLHEVFEQFRLSDEKAKKQVSKILGRWGKYEIFPQTKLSDWARKGGCTVGQAAPSGSSSGTTSALSKKEKPRGQRVSFDTKGDLESRDRDRGGRPEAYRKSDDRYRGRDDRDNRKDDRRDYRDSRGPRGDRDYGRDDRRPPGRDDDERRGGDQKLDTNQLWQSIARAKEVKNAEVVDFRKRSPANGDHRGDDSKRPRTAMPPPTGAPPPPHFLQPPPGAPPPLPPGARNNPPLPPGPKPPSAWSVPQPSGRGNPTFSAQQAAEPQRGVPKLASNNEPQPPPPPAKPSAWATLGKKTSTFGTGTKKTTSGWGKLAK